MKKAKYFNQNKNDNDDIAIPLNKKIKIDYYNQPLSTKNKLNIGISPIINYQNISLNTNKISNDENLKTSNSNISPSLKDQILSPGDDDILPNFNINKIPRPKLSNYLDDDIIFKQLNYHYLSRNINNFSLKNKSEKQNEEYNKLNIYSNSNNKNNKKTLILDLDETLVHSSFKPINYNNTFHKPDIFLSIDFRGNTHNVYVLKRPYVNEFLKEMNKIYNIIIFTASVKEYANPLLNVLDNEKIIKKRFFREDCCIGTTGKFIKDLKKLNMNLKDLILVDNNPISYSYNICNGVPIKTWHYDKTDQELIKLIPVLQFLANVNDVRDYIPKIVVNDEIDFRKINLMINEISTENVQNKYLRPRAKSQKRFLGYKEKKNNSINYGYNNIINNNNFDINYKTNINGNNKKRIIYEESKTNPETYNNKKKIYYDSLDYKNIKLNKNKNIEKNKEIYQKDNIIGFRNTNNNIEYKNNSNYNYNDYLKKNDNNHLNKKEKSDFIKKERHRNDSEKSYLKNNNNIQSIQSYYKKKYCNENIYTLTNNYLNQEHKNQRNKSHNNDNKKERKDLHNLSSPSYKDKQVNLYENIKNNAYIQYLNDNLNKNIFVQRKDNLKINYLVNYEEKINNGYITPQMNSKYTSNYLMGPSSNKNANTILNIDNNKHLNFNYIKDYNKIMEKENINNQGKYINYNINDENFRNSEITKNNASNFNRFYKDFYKNDFNYKYNSLKKPINNFEKTNTNLNLNKEFNKNLESQNDFEINTYNKTAINFYQTKTSGKNIYNNNLNSNSNLNLYLNILNNKEESKINNYINHEKNDIKNEHNYNKHNSPYKISKETNYYIKRRMKLNKEKNINKKKQNDNLYVSFNNIF